MHVYLVFKYDDELELPVGVYDTISELSKAFKISERSIYLCLSKNRCFYKDFIQYRIMKVNLALSDL